MSDGAKREVALVPALPRGLVVRTESVVTDEGPYRGTASTHAIVELDVIHEWQRRRNPWLLGAELLSPLALMVPLTIVLGLEAGLLVLMLVSLAVGIFETIRRQRIALFRLEPGHLALAAGQRVPLGDIRGIAVRSHVVPTQLHREQVHEVVLETPSGEVVAAKTPAADQAGAVAAMIAAALAGRR
jgi:hypothetical protein